MIFSIFPYQSKDFVQKKKKNHILYWSFVFNFNFDHIIHV